MTGPAACNSGGPGAGGLYIQRAVPDEAQWRPRRGHWIYCTLANPGEATVTGEGRAATPNGHTPGGLATAYPHRGGGQTRPGWR